jgi:hypothetical protein
MPLIRNIEDPRFVKQLDGINHRNQFIRELASAILPGKSGLESVLSIANRVYDRHCAAQGSPSQARSLNRRGFARPQITSLSA